MQDKLTDHLFHEALEQVLKDIHQGCGVRIIFKDASAIGRQHQPGELIEHRSAYCMAIKGAKARLAQCRQSDELAEADHPVREPYLRSCPFGVEEIVVPLWLAGRYQGCLFIGGWHKPGRRVEAFSEKYDALGYMTHKKGYAIARIARAAVMPILPLREQEQYFRLAKQDELIDEALNYIEMHLHAGLRVPEVAEAVGLSESRFLHRFAQVVELGFGAYVRSRVMIKAENLLLESNMTMSDLAYELGYQNQNHFAVVFKKHAGLAPTAFRKKREQSVP